MTSTAPLHPGARSGGRRGIETALDVGVVDDHRGAVRRVASIGEDPVAAMPQEAVVHVQPDGGRGVEPDAGARVRREAIDRRFFDVNRTRVLDVDPIDATAQIEDLQVAQRHVARGIDDDRIASIADDTSHLPGNREDLDRLVDVDGCAVVIRGIQHPDLSAVVDRGERRRQKPAGCRKRACIGVAAVERKVRAEEARLGSGRRPQPGGGDKDGKVTQTQTGLDEAMEIKLAIQLGINLDTGTGRVAGKSGDDGSD